MKNKNAILIILVICSMVIWGISWPSNKILTHYGNAIDLGVFRYVTVSLSLYLVFPMTGISLKIKPQGWIYVGIAGVLMALYNYAFLEGLHHGSSGAGGILVTTLNPIFAFLIGVIVDWKLPRKNEAVGLMIGLLAGLTLLEIWSNVSVFSSPGNLLFLLCAVVWASISKFTSKAAKYGSPLAYSWWMYVITLVALLPFCSPSNLITMVQITDLKFWGNILFSGVITTTFASTIFFYATSKIGAEKTSSYIFVVPLSAAFFSFILLGEHTQLHTLIGGILGVVAVIFINKK